MSYSDSDNHFENQEAIRTPTWGSKRTFLKMTKKVAKIS